MSSEINKIHVNNSTRVSLNDRFTAFSVRSASRPKQVRIRRNQEVPHRVSEANRKLLQRLKAQDKSNSLMKIQRNAVRGRPMLVRKRQSGTAINKQILKGEIVKNARNLRTSRRLNSTGNIASRLGTVNGRIRRASVPRSSSQPRGRSRTRFQNGGRSNSQNRSNSVNRGRSNSNNRVRSNSQIRGRSNSRNRGVGPRGRSLTRASSKPNVAVQQNRQNLRSRSASRNRQLRNVPNKRSVANRLGNVKTGINKGRIQKRQQGTIGGQKNIRQSRSRVRGVQAVNQRSNSRGRNNNNNQNKRKATPQRGGKPGTPARRGRSRSRSRNRNAKGEGKKPNLNREALDKELDQYMATSKMTM